MTNDALSNFLDCLKTDVIHSLQANGKMATGQSAQQMKIVNDGDKAQLKLPGYLHILETGRAPTGPNPIAGNPPMIDRIKAWCAAKGVPDKAAWAIKKSIDKNGYKGTPGILSEPLGDDNINLRLSPATEEMAGTIVQNIIDSTNLI
ncbi:MAG TPA: hypothetical protein VFE54_03350 [Mucilaginibacter sp.]|jgi:hypothetical protein|nr:hypothetical protein [Mucilaginibacter sp.]